VNKNVYCSELFNRSILKKLIHLIPVILTGYLTACGGGGDSETSSTVEPTYPSITTKHTSVSITDRSIKLNEDTVYEGSLTIDDTLDLKWKIISNAKYGTATLTETGNLRFIPNKNFHGMDGITVKATDGNTADTARILFDVKSTNNLPVVNSKTIFDFSGQQISDKISATDADDDTLIYRVNPNFNGPEYISFKLKPNGTFKLVSKMKSSHSIIIPIIISDGEGAIETTLTFNIEPIKKKYISEQSFVLNEDMESTFKIKTTNTTAPSFTLSTAPSKGEAKLDENGLLTYTPNRDFYGPDSLEITVIENGYSDKAKISLSITSVNDAPKIQGKRTFKSFKNTINSQITATDPDGDNLTFKLKQGTTLPKGVHFTIDKAGYFKITGDNNTINNRITLPIVVSDASESIEANFTFYINMLLPDPLYAQQWHLNNTGQNAFSETGGTPGHDINIGRLHENRITGTDVKVAVVDTGLEIRHPDLVDNILSGRSYNYETLSNDPTSTRTRLKGDHGTAVAGLIAERGFNNIGGRGVAPTASLIGLNLLTEKGNTMTNWYHSHGGKGSYDALVINQSYIYKYQSRPRTFMTSNNKAHEAWLKTVTSENNNKRGVLFVKGAGNFFLNVGAEDSAYSRDPSLPRVSAHNTAIDISNASFYNTVVSALNANANDPLASYSSTGSAVFVSAPGGDDGRGKPGMITTDRVGCSTGYARDISSGFNGDQSLNPNCDYMSTFNGTSAATPIVSGVAALIFSVDENITWRDVRYIIAKTARKIDVNIKPIKVTSAGEDFIAELDWIENAAGFNFHNWYGFGLIDASAAVKMAQSYTTKDLLPKLEETRFISSDNETDLAIRDLQSTEKSVNITQKDNLIIEAVQLKIRIKHERISDLSIELISPQGTRSMILTPRSLLTTKFRKYDNFKDTVLLSNAFYGERSMGTWKIKVTDTNEGDFIYYRHGSESKIKNNKNDGLLKGVSIRIYGHEGI